jgi:nucleoside phosphorylase
MTQHNLRIQDYTIGWVCALPIELAAATEMLDEEHQDVPQDGNDTNLYTLGRISGHNVVLACLPAGQMGTSSAATVAIQMQSKFTSLRFSLMVGIGGGVPSAESGIRLGDVVISQPNMQYGGVVQYDFGKTGASEFTRTGSLNTPPTILLNALAKLRSNHFRLKSNLSVYLSMVSHLSSFAYGNAGPDVLFDPTYNHIEGPTCDWCSKDRLVERILRGNQEVVVHYGTIASGNQVIKDGITRDRLSSELGGVLCFEMEAAGLMNSFPCLVIRGICDYADSHKNKRWQPYAAATAAACAKELLSIVPAAEVVTARTIDEATGHRLQNDSAKTINQGGSVFSGTNKTTTGRIIQLGNVTMGDGDFTL